jgi:hypothetical protein
MALFRRHTATATPSETEPEDAVEVEVVDDVPPPPDPDADLPPSRMRGTEPLYGYVVGLELLVVAILNLTVHTGAGAPAHPQTALEVLGVVASIAFMALISVRNRTVVGLGAIVAAFFVTLPKSPNSLQTAHILALVFPLIYGIVITQRQRKAVKQTITGGRGAAQSGVAARARQRDEQRSQSRQATRQSGRRTKEAPATGPTASARYTPPKAKRGR